MHANKQGIDKMTQEQIFREYLTENDTLVKYISPNQKIWSQILLKNFQKFARFLESSNKFARLGYHGHMMLRVQIQWTKYTTSLVKTCQITYCIKYQTGWRKLIFTNSLCWVKSGKTKRQAFKNAKQPFF